MFWSKESIAIDIGTLYHTALSGLRIGAALTNFGADMKALVVLLSCVIVFFGNSLSQITSDNAREINPVAQDEGFTGELGEPLKIRP